MSGSWITSKRRQGIYDRDHHRCVYCDTDLTDASSNEITLDHLLARALGGTNASRNLVTCCKSCNSAKNTLSVTKFIERLGEQGHDGEVVEKRIRNARRRKVRTSKMAS